jgi:hypothetical protein
MATVKKMKKAQDGMAFQMKKDERDGRQMVSKIKEANKNSKSTDRKMGLNFDKKSFDSLPELPMKKGPKSELIPPVSIRRRVDSGPTKPKAKSGGSFPDLNKDGKITKADILKGRGVIAKSGTKMKKGGMIKKTIKKK